MSLIILPRSDWTSTPDNRDVDLQPSRVTMMVAHYPADGNVTNANLTKAQVAAKLRGYRAGHLAKGWRDIGYNYAVDQAGRVWHLTGLDVGAHANAVGNTQGVGVLFVVGNNEPISAAAIAAFRELRAWVLKRLPKAISVKGHQQVPGNSTACPGGPLMALVKAGTLAKAPGTTTPPAEVPVTAVWGKPATWGIGSVGPDATRIGERIRIWWKHYGWGDPYKVGPSSPYSETDRAALSRLQVQWGYGSAPADLALGGGSDGFPGTQSFAKLASNPPGVKPPVTPPAVELVPMRVAALNHGDYEKTKGAKTAKTRALKTAKQLLTYGADAIVFCELAKGTLATMDKALAPGGYRRAPSGGKGREIYIGPDLEHIASGLLDVETEHQGDDKPFAYEIFSKANVRGEVVSFHNENDNVDSVQVAQMREVLTGGLEVGKQYDVDAVNIGWFGDSNEPTTEDRVEAWGYVSAGKRAPSIGNGAYKTMTHWLKKALGKPIDVAIFRSGARLKKWWQRIDPRLSDHNIHVTDYYLQTPKK